MKTSEFKISIWAEIYNKKTAENYRNCYVSDKRIISKPEFARISHPYLLQFPRNKPVGQGSGRVGVVNRFKLSTWSKNGQTNLFHFFLKILELFDGCRGDPYITATKNFVRFAHSYPQVAARSGFLILGFPIAFIQYISYKFSFSHFAVARPDWRNRGLNETCIGYSKIYSLKCVLIE